MKRISVIFHLVLLCSLTGISQTGKEFWFSIPYVDKTHDSDGDNNVSNTTNYFRVSTGEIGSEVTFYKFSGGTRTVLCTKTISSNSVTDVSVGNTGTPDISLSSFVIDQYNTVLDRGIYIVSTSPISIYYEIGSPNNTELFALKGSDALGTEFYPILQNTFKNKNEITGGCGGWALDSWTTLDIIATEDNTTVDIDLPTSSSGGVQTIEVYTDTYRISPILKRRALGTPDVYYPQNPQEDIYTQTRTLTYLNGVLQSTVLGAQTWLVDTLSDDYNVTKAGIKVIDEWWNNPAGVDIELLYFLQQLDLTKFPITQPTLSSSSVLTSSTTTVTPISYIGSSVTSIALDSGEVYSIKAESQNAVKLLGGVRITSDLPVSVLMKDDGVFDGSCGGDVAADLIGDQIVPTSKSGKAFIIPDFDGKILVTDPVQEQHLYIRALEDGTDILVDGVVVASIDQGDVYTFSDFDKDNTYKLVTSNNKSFQCYHLASYPSNQVSVSEFAGAMVPPVDICTGSTITAFVRPENTTFRPVLISRSNTGFSYRKAGDASWTSFTPTFSGPITIGAQNWYFAIDANVGLGNPDANVNYLIKNSGSTFHFGFLQKRTTGTSHGAFYGYFSDFSAPELLLGFMFTDIDPDPGVEDMRVRLSAVGGVEGTYDWDMTRPTPATNTCIASYFSSSTDPTTTSDCDNSNPTTLDGSIITGQISKKSYTYACDATSACAGAISNQVEFYVENEIAVLPVELINFKATCINSYKIIEWTTMSETNNENFMIYRSYDGIHFEIVGTIDGKGTTSKKNFYSFKDSDANKGITYYKLKQIDFDGKTSESKVISTNCSSSGCQDIFPTLCKQNDQISIFCEDYQNKWVKIISITGIVLQNIKLDSESNQNQITLSIPKGTYFLQLSDNNQVISNQKIIVR